MKIDLLSKKYLYFKMNKWADRRTDASSALTEFLLRNPERMKLRVLSIKIFDNNKDNDYKIWHYLIFFI